MSDCVKTVKFTVTRHMYVPVGYAVPSVHTQESVQVVTLRNFAGYDMRLRSSEQL